MFSKKLDKARDAYNKKDIKASKDAHEAFNGIEEQHNVEGQYIKSFVYGGLDGIITTFAVVAGVAGASLSSGVILILGFANLIADGLSMAIGDYLSTKAENDYSKSERMREEWEVENYPEGERKEVVEIYKAKGISDEDANMLADILSKYKNAMVDLMMTDELGLMESSESPLKNAAVTFISFIIFGFIPLSIYLIGIYLPNLENVFYYTILLTMGTLFSLGAVKGKVTGKNIIRSGFEMLLIGGVAALAAYGIGHFLADLAN